MSLPVYQLRKGQSWPTELLIEPETEVMQDNLCRQTGLQSAEFMRPLPVQAKGMQELVVDRFDDLADARQPATQGLGPRGLARALGGQSTWAP